MSGVYCIYYIHVYVCVLWPSCFCRRDLKNSEQIWRTKQKSEVQRVKLRYCMPASCPHAPRPPPLLTGSLWHLCQSHHCPLLLLPWSQRRGLKERAPYLNSPTPILLPLPHSLLALPLPLPLSLPPSDQNRRLWRFLKKRCLTCRSKHLLPSLLYILVSTLWFVTCSVMMSVCTNNYILGGIMELFLLGRYVLSLKIFLLNERLKLWSIKLNSSSLWCCFCVSFGRGLNYAGQQSKAECHSLSVCAALRGLNE